MSYTASNLKAKAVSQNSINAIIVAVDALLLAASEQGNFSIEYTVVTTPVIANTLKLKKDLEARGFTVTPDGTTPALLTIAF